MGEVDCDVHPLSGMNPIGRLFWREKRLYRGITPQFAPHFRNLLSHGVIQKLTDRKLLIDSWEADWTTSEFPLVIEHRVLPVVSFPPEWCASQLKAAALHVLDLEIALRADNFTLTDIHPWNVLFDGVNPYFVDLGSVHPLSGTRGWSARLQFHEFFLNPLLLFHKGLPRVARRMLFDPWRGVSADEMQRMGVSDSVVPQGNFTVDTVKQFVKSVAPRSLHPTLKKTGRLLSSRAPKDVTGWIRKAGDALPEILALRDRVEALSVAGPKTGWEGYYDKNFPEFTPSSTWQSKQHAINNILTQVKPKTLLDIGSNRGWYSQLAARHGAHVIAADSDEMAVNKLYADAKSANLSLLPIVMDVRFPEPAQGPAYEMLAPATQRLKSEMVLALAVIHHLVFAWYLNFEQIVETLSMFSSKWLVVEFIGHKDSIFIGPDGGAVPGWDIKIYPWYRLETFLLALGKYFEIVQQIPSDHGGVDERVADRTIIFCKRK